MNPDTRCTDCESTEAASCTVCGKPVCPEHRSGTGRLADGYQCATDGRKCWAARAEWLHAALQQAVDGQLNMVISRRSASLMQRRMPLFNLAVTLLDKDTATWFNTPHPELGDRSPLSILDTDDGAADVEAVLRKVQRGV